MDEKKRPIAIDPPDCGCTECIVGEYVPLREASEDQIAQMLRGELRDHTSVPFRVSARWELYDPHPDSQHLVSVQVIADLWNGTTLTWDVTPYLDVLPGQVFGPPRD
ncbi:hypothetical protein ACGF12_30280 [Kitasatospora sp. NPDC048296]|uniref:hypothetical protein n=1 Tax=Kitasatospora sp. NPDC048296 TaxID=3364048 RepID=UPI0037198DF3